MVQPIAQSLHVLRRGISTSLQVVSLVDFFRRSGAKGRCQGRNVNPVPSEMFMFSRSFFSETQMSAIVCNFYSSH